MLPLTTRAELIRLGHNDHELERMVSAGTLLRPYRGIYAWPSAAEAFVLPEDQHLLRARAVAMAAQTPVALGHVSAAILHGLPVPRAELARVRLVNPTSNGGSWTKAIRISRCRLEPQDLVEVDGVLATSLPRTLIDLGRDLDEGWAVAAMDQALRSGACSSDDLQAALDRLPQVRGVRAAQRAVRSSDPRSESVGESLSRVLFLRAGIAPDQLQRTFYHPRGKDRVDFWWADGVIGEFDGEVKYQANSGNGNDPAKALFLEKQREDRLRRQGYAFIRWIWNDIIRRPQWVVTQVRAAITSRR